MILLPIITILLQAVILIVLLLKKETVAQIRLEAIEKSIERVEKAHRDEQLQSRSQYTEEARLNREELSSTLKQVSDSLLKSLSEISSQQNSRLHGLTESNAQKVEELKVSIDKRLELLQKNNEQKLEQMRATVDEKLQGTLEKRLGESFKHVSERLEQVHKGLGEMQTLAVGVGDLKKVLTNVKTRGVWGEVVLRTLLEEMLTPAQYESNVKTNPGTDDLVEFAIKLPGTSGDQVYLPIDSKFPSEDYQRLVEAQDNANIEGVDTAGKQLEIRVKQCAKDIHTKYLHPPQTTDFAIMFLPSEGLYAEVARRGALLESIQRDYRIVVAGPATFSALLNSLQMGFRTVAIEKRSSEVWKVLGEVKREFSKFGATLDVVKKKLESASNSIDDTAVRSRAIERKLKNVEALPVADAGNSSGDLRVAMDVGSIADVGLAAEVEELSD